jgi:hypothetical protein
MEQRRVAGVFALRRSESTLSALSSYVSSPSPLYLLNVLSKN